MNDTPPTEDRDRRFVIACLAGRRLPAARAEALSLASAGALDWEAVWALAERERVGPLLYQAAGRDLSLPAWLLRRGEEAYIATGLTNALRLREASSLLARLAEAGINVMALKGLALAERVYGNVALRPMVDSDLLVRRRDVRAALAVLESAGYQPARPEIAPDVALAFENEVMLTRRDRLDWALELHWSLFDSPFYQARLTEHSLWAGAVPLRIDDTLAFAPSPELELLHLCGHLALHHRGRGLLWWNDVAEAVGHAAATLDWEALLATAIALDLVLPVQVVLPTAANEWGAAVPPGVLERLAALAPRPAEARVYALLTGDQPPPGRRLLADIQGMTGRRARLRFLWHNLFPSAAYMDERYGIARPWQRPFYYLYRWWRGMGDLLRA